jgi:para-nitrobenzyl esterase
MARTWCSRAAVLLVLCAACTVADEASLAARRVAHTRNGPVEGAVDAAGGTRWVGVPYAAPPVDELRFRAPRPAAPWVAPMDCSRRRREMCPQLQSFLHIVVIGKEDCLYANVFAPPPEDESLLPVLVFFHGGAYVLGDDSEGGLYDGTRLAVAARVLVVSFNYRLGVLGFLHHAALLDGNETTSNYGLLDQRFFLQWVRDNAGSFGGDPARVTLFGQSAGAMSVCAHVAAPASEGLFRAAIIESGNCDASLLWAPLAAAQRQGLEFAAAHGCADADDAAACLRSAPLARLLANDLQPTDGAPLAPLVVWVPVVDGAAAGVPELPLLALQRSRRVPVIIGTVRDEGTMFAKLAPALMGDAPLPLTDAQLAALLARVYNATSVATMLQRYPDGSAAARLSAILRDALFVCPARRAAAALATAGGDAYLYHFTFPLRAPDKFAGLGTFHSSELEYVFGNPRLHVFDKDERAMAVSARLLAFVLTASPALTSSRGRTRSRGCGAHLHTTRTPPRAAWRPHGRATTRQATKCWCWMCLRACKRTPGRACAHFGTRRTRKLARLQ